MMKIITFLITVVFGLYISCVDVVSVAAKTRKPIMGILTLEERGWLSTKEAAIISDQLQKYLAQTGVFEIVERDKIIKILQEQSFQQDRVCNTTECALKIGKVIGAEQMLVGSVEEMGMAFSFTVQVIDVEASQIVKTISRDYNGPIDQLMTRGTRDIAREIAGLPPVTESGKRWVWMVVGGVLAAGGGSALILLRGGGGESGPIPLPPEHP